MAWNYTRWHGIFKLLLGRWRFLFHLIIIDILINWFLEKKYKKKRRDRLAFSNLKRNLQIKYIQTVLVFQYCVGVVKVEKELVCWDVLLYLYHQETCRKLERIKIRQIQNLLTLIYFFSLTAYMDWCVSIVFKWFYIQTHISCLLWIPNQKYRK